MLTIDLTAKTALITGSSRGLGRHYALHLARAGADVIIHDINEVQQQNSEKLLQGQQWQRRYVLLAAEVPIYPRI